MAEAVTSEVIEGPTPNGGVKAIAYFRDGSGKPSSKEKAVNIEVVEYNSKGEAIHRTYQTKKESR